MKEKTDKQEREQGLERKLKREKRVIGLCFISDCGKRTQHFFHFELSSDRPRRQPPDN